MNLPRDRRPYRDLSPKEQRQWRRRLWLRRNLPQTVGEWIFAIVILIVGLVCLVVAILTAYLVVLLLLAGIDYLKTH